MNLGKVNHRNAVLFVLLVTAGLSVVSAGFAAGYTYGTGQSPLTLVMKTESIAPPQEVTTGTLDTVVSVLDEQPEQIYQEGYNCLDYAWDGMRALMWQGELAAIVRLGFEGGEGHALLLVPTADKGYQFIDPQTGKIVRPLIGAHYAGRVIANMTILEFTWVPFDVFQLDPKYGMQGWEEPN
jgi:hypothetical protein